MRRVVLVVAVVSCGTPSPRNISSEPGSEAQQQPAPVAKQDAACNIVYVDRGVEHGLLCAADARAKGLTIVDLTDTWTPSLLAAGPAGELPSFHASYLAIAAEVDAKGRRLEGEDALDELYGVLPALSVLRTRLADDARHACHATIDNAPIAKLDKALAQDYQAEVKAGDDFRKWLVQLLDAERKKRNLPDFAALDAVAVDNKALGVRLAQWKKLDDQYQGLVAAQAHFRCEGFLDAKETDGLLTWRTGNAIELFQRRNFLMPDERLKKETRDALALDSHELDFRLALRILRERVVDASGIVEDGTAGTGPQPILGRALDPEAMRAARGGQPLPNAAPDLVGAATEAAAKQLGWIGPSEVRAFLDRHKDGLRVALALPPPPAYHAAHMNLSAEIDRGDIWYDDEAPPFRRIPVHRPALIVYVDDQGTKRPLIRWPTTIGGWADQRMADGELVQRWKESDVGPRVWRDLYAGPTWLPPPSTPDRDLVKNLYNGHYGLKTEVMGPGPHAAYGMMLLVHHQVVKLKDGTERFDDNGIGTHGSASVTSIVNGTSHGCHRLYNQLAVRLADFLLRHRDHVVRGEQKDWYRRYVNYKDEHFFAKIDSRGYLYELTPPIPVNVLKGKILSPRKIPPMASSPARAD